MDRMYSFDVASASHDMLKSKRPYIWSRVTITADTDAEAHWVACEFAEMTTGMMTVELRWRI